MTTGNGIDEKRGQQRFSINGSLTVQELSRSQKTPIGKIVSGVIHNVSKAGIGISTTAPLTYAAVIRCDVAVKNVPVAIPTIAQVRWVKRSHGGEYRSGLAYVL